MNLVSVKTDESHIYTNFVLEDALHLHEHRVTIKTLYVQKQNKRLVRRYEMQSNNISSIFKSILGTPILNPIVTNNMSKNLTISFR
jgi:hypothetical protein